MIGGDDDPAVDGGIVLAHQVLGAVEHERPALFPGDVHGGRVRRPGGGLNGPDDGEENGRDRRGGQTDGGAVGDDLVGHP